MLLSARYSLAVQADNLLFLDAALQCLQKLRKRCWGSTLADVLQRLEFRLNAVEYLRTLVPDKQKSQFRITRICTHARMKAPLDTSNTRFETGETTDPRAGSLSSHCSPQTTALVHLAACNL
jgi:uncharacterized protein (DUF2461 family)